MPSRRALPKPARSPVDAPRDQMEHGNALAGTCDEERHRDRGQFRNRPGAEQDPLPQPVRCRRHGPARRVARGDLHDLRRELGGDVFVERIDLADVESARHTLSRFIEQLGGVDLVVITAGTGHLNPDLDWTLENEAIQTNVTGFAAAANVAVKHFLERGAGHLVGISSIAALRGGRISPAYNASKAFESNYLEGLRQKVRKLGLPIAVTDVKPGFVKTAMAKGDLVFWAADASKAARQIHAAIQRRKSHVYITRRWRLVACLLKLLPGFVYERL